MNIVSWNTTFKCNQYCSHCYRDASIESNTSTDLSTEEGKKMLRDMKKAGINMVVLSGGEPLLRPDIFDLAQYGRDQGLIMALGSNGTLIDQAMVEKIKDSGIKSVAISLDSAKAQVHDAFRGMEGAWDKTIRAVQILKSMGLRVQINFTVSRINKDEILDVLKLAEDLGAVSTHVLFLVETGRGQDMAESYLSKKEYEEAIRQVLTYESEMYIRPVCAPQAMVLAQDLGQEERFGKGCLAGLSYCSVLADGQVHICPYATIKAGDLKEDSFDKIWHESPVFKVLRDFEGQEDKECGACSFNPQCGGCRARALSKTGDYLGFDPYCLL